MEKVNKKRQTLVWLCVTVCSSLLVCVLLIWVRSITRPASSSQLFKELPDDLLGEKKRLEAEVLQNSKDAGLYHRLGNVNVKLNRMDEAATAYKKEISLNPAAAGAYLNLGNVYFFMADKNPVNLNQAIAYYSQCVVLDPNSVEGHFNLAYALYGKKDNQAALEQLDEVLKLEPANDHALTLKKKIQP